MPQAPCGWTPTHIHHSPTDLAEWTAYPAATKAAADSAASYVLWAVTGRQFGACATIARPVLCPRYTSSAWTSVSAPWVPVDLGTGSWVNWPADTICADIDPARVRLLGPVNTVTSVTVLGAVVLPANYRVDDGEWLVRTDGLSWPLWQDINLPGTDPTAFVVNYTQGVPVTAVLAQVAGTYALEWARASSPTASTACRLPSRAKSIVRQGVTIDMVDPTTLLERGLTGIAEVDAIITSYNPRHLIAQPRVLVPSGHAPVVGA